MLAFETTLADVKCVLLTRKKKQQKETIISHKIPDCPLEKAGCDILHFDDKNYICSVDYFSSYFKVDCLKDKTTREVVQTIKRHFATHGIPNKFVSDNGPPYSCHEFQQFVQSYDIEHVTSSPNNPQSESAVKTTRSLLKKSKAASTDFHLAFLDWRNTPSDSLESSPKQHLFGRRTRTLVPTASELVKKDS